MAMTLTPDTIDRFRSSLFARGRSANTVTAYSSDLTEFMFWAPEVIQEVNFDRMATRWLNEHRNTWAPKTTTRRATSLRGFAKWAKWPQENLSDYKAPNPGRAVPHPLAEGIEGVLRLCDVAENDELRALVALCGLAGLRLSEALGLTVGSFDFSRRELTVRGKGDVTRVVPMSNKLCEMVIPAITTLAAIHGDAMTPYKYLIHYRDRGARAAITRLGRKAGLSRPIASHDLRATFATAAYDKSLDLRATQELLGHADSKTTEGYIKVRMNKMRDAADVA